MSDEKLNTGTHGLGGDHDKTDGTRFVQISCIGKVVG